jgi:pilus assembly protein FimV
MEEEVTCPHCAVTGLAFGSPVGTKLRCPQCEKVFLLTQELLTGSLVSEAVAVDMAEVVPGKAAIVPESAVLPEVEPVLMSEGMEGSEPELAAAPDERQSAPEMAVEAAAPRLFTGIQASAMAMESADMTEVVPAEAVIVAEPAAVPEVEPVSIPESAVLSEQKLTAAPDERPSVPEIAAEVAAEAVSPRHFTGIQASPMAMESSVGRGGIAPVEAVIVAEPAALPVMEPAVSIPESTVLSEQKLTAAPDERPSVPEIVAEVAAKAVSPRHFAGIQASPMAMESSVEVVTEVPEKIVTVVEIVPELQLELEIPSALEPVAEPEPAPEPAPELKPEFELEPELEQIPEVKAEEMFEPMVEVLSEPAMETVAEVVVETIPEPVQASGPEEIVEPLPGSELVSDVAPEAEASSIAEEAAPGEMKEEEVLVEEEPAPPVLPMEICRGCGESFHPQLLQDIDGIRYCGVCQLRMAATAEKAPRVGGGRLRGVLAAMILLGLLALIALLLMKFGIF